MQKVIRVFLLLIFLICLNDLSAAEMHLSVDTTIKTDVTLKEYPITNLAGITEIKKGNPEHYYGTWQWISNTRDTFTMILVPGKGKTAKGGMSVGSDIVCYYNISKQGTIVINTDMNSEYAMQTDLYGYVTDKQLLLYYTENIINLDGSMHCIFELIEKDKKTAVLKRGTSLPFFAKAFGNISIQSVNNVPADLIMKKVSTTF